MFRSNDALQKIRQHEEQWDLYTRKEEYSPRQLDRYERFMYTYSTNKGILEPRVSKYLINNGYEIEYPDGKQFAVCLTHDVDEIYPPLKHTLLSTLTCLKKLDFGGFKQQAFWKLHGKEKSPYWNFQEIMDLEEQYGARSSFYFLATDSDIRRFRYNVDDLEGELGRIVDRGWEVGLHGGYYAYNDLEAILREKDRLERVLIRKVTGYRNHYLRFCVPDSWEILAETGFKYDTTLGYPDMVGFRNGMCHPFRPFNRNTGTGVDILELPLAVMDGPLFALSGIFQNAWDTLKRCIDTISLQNGVLVVNWHSNTFNCPFKHLWECVYNKLLIYCKQKGAWLTSGEEIIKFWQRNVV